ncbi:MAG: hypothetical protein ABSF82_08060 [Candidatus Bathyarchaeia archaeon]
MAQTFHPQEGDGRKADQLGLVGIYTCLLCEESFSTKVELKLHYCSAHWECIPDYEGGKNIHPSSHLSPDPVD